MLIVSLYIVLWLYETIYFNIESVSDQSVKVVFFLLTYLYSLTENNRRQLVESCRLYFLHTYLRTLIKIRFTYLLTNRR